MTDFRSARLQKLSLHFFAAQTDRIAALKASGADIIHLDIGSPDLPPPEPAVEALVSNARLSNTHGYQPHNFSEAYRNAWAAFYQRNFQVQLDPDREIVSLLGSKEGIFHLMQAVVNPGDIVLVPDPGYITYRSGIELAGGQAVSFSLDAKNNYLPDFDAIPLSVISQTRFLWLNYPNNPTSATATLDFFIRAVEFAHRNHLMICHDAAYAKICYDGYLAPSILQVPGARDVSVEFNTLSKSHAMAGWRVGIIAGNPDLLSALYKLKTNADSGHFQPVIQAATAALEVGEEWIAPRNLLYQERRDILLKAFSQLNWHAYHSPAGLYVWVRIPSFAQDSQQLARMILDKIHISVTPGIVFGAQDQYLRFSLTTATKKIQEAAERLVKWINDEY